MPLPPPRRAEESAKNRPPVRLGTRACIAPVRASARRLHGGYELVLCLFGPQTAGDHHQPVVVQAGGQRQQRVVRSHADGDLIPLFLLLCRLPAFLRSVCGSSRCSCRSHIGIQSCPSFSSPGKHPARRWDAVQAGWWYPAREFRAAGQRACRCRSG